MDTPTLLHWRRVTKQSGCRMYSRSGFMRVCVQPLMETLYQIRERLRSARTKPLALISRRRIYARAILRNIKLA